MRNGTLPDYLNGTIINVSKRSDARPPRLLMSSDLKFGRAKQSGCPSGPNDHNENVSLNSTSNTVTPYSQCVTVHEL
jgi:hypothetical protein